MPCTCFDNPPCGYCTSDDKESYQENKNDMIGGQDDEIEYGIAKYFDTHFEYYVEKGLTLEVAKRHLKRHPSGCYESYEVKRI